MLILMIAFTPFLAHAGAYKGASLQAVLKETALEKCGYAPPSLKQQGKQGKVMVYQFTCGSIFKVVSVGCIAFANESQVDMAATPIREYRYGRPSQGEQSPIYVCQ